VFVLLFTTKLIACCLLFKHTEGINLDSLPFAFCVIDVDADGKLPLFIDTAVLLLCLGCVAALLS
jgi:hypothetical protein